MGRSQLSQKFYLLNFWWISILFKKSSDSYNILQPILSMPPILTSGWSSHLDQYKYKAATSQWTYIYLKLVTEREDLAYLCQQRIGSLKLPTTHPWYSCAVERQMAYTACHNSAFSCPVKCRVDTGIEAVRLQLSHVLHCPGRTGRWNVFFWISSLLSWLSNFTAKFPACGVGLYLFLSLKEFK